MSPYQLVRPKGKGKMKRKREGEEEREKKEGRRGGKGTQWVRESQWRGYALSSAGKESSTCFEGGESPSISARPRLKTTPYLRFALELANNKALWPIYCIEQLMFVSTFSSFQETYQQAKKTR